MNIEKLNSLANDIVLENKKLQFVAKFQNLLNTLQNVIAQPQQPQHQKNLTTQLTDLKESLINSLVNNLSPAWYQVLVELQIDEVLGLKLIDKIDMIFSKNQITPANAKIELDKIFTVLNQKINGFTNIVSGLKILNIGLDELEEGECEIGVLIPRKYIKNDLGKFGDEIKELTFIFSNYSELIIGKKESFQIRNISTSEPLITVTTVTAIVVGVAKSIGWLIDNYKKLLEIKKLKSELNKQGLSDANLQGIVDYSNSFMEKSIENIVKKLSKEYNANGDVARKNELLNGVRISLNKIANRIDNGFNFEIRIEPIVEKENTTTKGNKTEVAAIEQVSKSLQFMKLEGQPILSLSEKKTKTQTK